MQFLIFLIEFRDGSVLKHFLPVFYLSLTLSQLPFIQDGPHTQCLLESSPDQPFCSPSTQLLTHHDFFLFQDLLMVTYLANLTQSQIALNEKLVNL